MNWEFDDETHRFTIDGQPTPSVTHVLQALGCTPWTDGLRGRGPSPHLERGKDVHASIKLYELGKLRREDLSGYEHVGYLDSWIEFRSRVEWKTHQIEKPMVCETSRYGGIPDITGTWHLGRRRVLADVKTGRDLPHYELQVSAYNDLLDEPHLRVLIFLRADGGLAQHKIIQSHDSTNAWRSAITLYHWRLRNGYLPIEEDQYRLRPLKGQLP